MIFDMTSDELRTSLDDLGVRANKAFDAQFPGLSESDARILAALWAIQQEIPRIIQEVVDTVGVPLTDESRSIAGKLAFVLHATLIAFGSIDENPTEWLTRKLDHDEGLPTSTDTD